MKYLLDVAILSAVALLSACNDSSSGHPASGPDNAAGEGHTARAASGEEERIEAALLDQISCRRPPQAGVAMTAMLRTHLIATTNDGGDGIGVFVPVRRLTLLGFDVVRMGGWQPDPEGGAMPPFSRGPGTSPPNHIFVTVRASEDQVRRALSGAGLTEAQYVPDHAQDAWVNSSGEVIQPQRLIPGPALQAGDYDLASNPVAGATTIACRASETDFEREVEAQFGG